METEDLQHTKTTLVLGGTGKTGRRVVERLEARGLPVRVGSRSGEPRSTGRMRPVGHLRCGVWGRHTSPTIRTWRCPELLRPSVLLPSWRWSWGWAAGV
jgi:hypothetical protein